MIVKPERKPNFGPDKPYPTEGAPMADARKVIVGFNVDLGTDDLKVAKRIAKPLQAKKDGFSNAKAVTVSVAEKNIMQICISISDFEKTPLCRVFKLLKVECARYNVSLIGSEFCGMAPLKALIDMASYHMKIDNVAEDSVLKIAIQNAIERGGVSE
jgi:glutamate formiminotransferase